MFPIINPAVVGHQHSLPFVADPNYLMANERMNLMNMAKLSIKGLIESALNLGRTLDSDYAPLQQFFVVMEHCLKHGLKGNSGAAVWGENRALQPARDPGEAEHGHCCGQNGLGRTKEGTKTCWRGKLRRCRCLPCLKQQFSCPRCNSAIRG